MTRLTVAIDEGVLLEAQKYAREKGTTVDHLVQEYLAHLPGPDDRRQQAMTRLLAAMEKGVVEIGERDWRREDLYDR